MALDRSKIEEAQAELEQLLEEGIGLTGKKAADHKLKVSRKRKELRQMEKQKAADALGEPLGESSAIDQKSEERIAAEREIKDQSQKDVRGENVNAMDKLRIGGKSTVRQEVDKQGRTKYRNEGSGRYANEEAYKDSESRVSMLADSIKKGATTGPTLATTTKATQFGISSASAKMSRSLGDHAGAIQQLMDNSAPGTQDEMKKLVQMMQDSQKLRGKEGQEAKQKILQQRETLRLTAGDKGDELITKLGMDDLQKDLNKGSRIKEALNIDQNAGFGTAIKQAFSPTRLFGDANTGGLSNFYTAGQKEAIARKEAAVAFEEKNQNRGLNTAGELLEVTKKEAKDEDKKEEKEARQAKKAQLAKEGFDGGVVTENYAEQQVTLLEEIKDLLEYMAKAGGLPGGGGGGGSMLATAGGAAAGGGIFAAAKSKVGNIAKGARAVGGKLLSGAGKLLRGRGALIAGGAALLGYGASKIFGGGDDEQGDALETQTMSSSEEGRKVNGVVVERNGEPRTDFTQEELNKINMARQASVQMGNPDPFPQAQGLQPVAASQAEAQQAEAQPQTPQPGEEGAGLELPSSGAVAATGAAGATIAGMGSGDAALTATMARGGGQTAAKATSVGGRMMSGLKTAGRVLGKVALPVTAGLAAYDAYKGFNADENASFGDKLKNAGSSVLSGLTFGLLGTSAEDTAVAATNGPPAEPESGDGDEDDGKKKGQAIKNSHPETGEGYQPLDPDGNPVFDRQGRPAIFTKENAEAFSAMMADSDGAVKGSDIASSQRSLAKNQSLRNASPTSKHMTGSAMDIHGTSNTWIRQNGSQYGWRANDYKGTHGGHFIAASGGPLPAGATAMAAMGSAGMMSSFGGGGGGASAPTPSRSAARSARSGSSETSSASLAAATPPTQGSIQPTMVAESPTGPAVENMTQLAANDTAPAPVVNNVTNVSNNSQGGVQGPPPTGVSPRLQSKSTLERYLDRRFYG